MPQITWQAPEFDYREKSVSWYWISIVVSVALLGAAVWQKNFFFGFFVVVAEILVITWGNKKPEMLEFSADDSGIHIKDRKTYKYTDLQSFGVDNEGATEWASIFLSFKSKTRPRVRIKAPKKDVGKIGSALSGYINQEEYDPSLLDSLEEFVGF